MRKQIAGQLVSGTVIAVIAALGVVQPGAWGSPSSSELYPNCPVIPFAPEGDEAQAGPDAECPEPPGERDDDGDGWVNLQDNCRYDYNPGQEDADQDGIGDLCDSTPYPPTQPPPTQPPTVPPPTQPTTQPTTVPTGSPVPPVPAPTATGTSVPGCQSPQAGQCTYPRSVELRRTGKKLAGTVSSTAAGCRTASVTLWLKRRGVDRRLVVVTTRSSGAFTTRSPRKPGLYYVTVESPDQPLCAPAVSGVVRVKR